MCSLLADPAMLAQPCAQADGYAQASALLDAAATGTGVGIDVALLDIEMPGGDGLSLARRCAQLHIPVIFTTAYDQYALQAFDVQAADYLLKPVRRERLAAALRRAESLIRPMAAASDAPATIAVTERGRTVHVPIEAIMLLRADMKYVGLQTADGEYLTEQSLAWFEQTYGERFIRLHRSCLVARDHLDALVRDDDGAERRYLAKIRGLQALGLADLIPISRRQVPIVRDALAAMSPITTAPESTD